MKGVILMPQEPDELHSAAVNKLGNWYCTENLFGVKFSVGDVDMEVDDSIPPPPPPPPGGIPPPPPPPLDAGAAGPTLPPDGYDYAQAYSSVGNSG